ncbi:unnamed protein product [Sphagnum compactum]
MKMRKDGGNRGPWSWRSRGGVHILKMTSRIRVLLVVLLVTLFGASILTYHFGLPVTNLESPDDDSTTKAGFPGMLEGEVFMCDRSQYRTDVCNMRGDIRMSNSTHFTLYAVDKSTPLGEEVVKPYTRKWEKSCMDNVHDVILHSVPSSLASNSVCDVQHSAPGVVFSTGGYTGNLYHEFHDGLIPLFITTQHLNREVVVVVSEFHEWWLTKYSEVIQEMSNYTVINFEEDQRLHCFPEVTVGLHIHGELSIDPTRMPDNKSILDFRDLLSRAYTPSPEELEPQGSEVPEGSTNVADASKVSGVTNMETTKQLTILVRNGTRVLLNLDKIVELASEAGFNVTLLSPDPTTELKRVFWILDKSDVLMGVHGAALTHFLFMRPGSVFIQIIPLGTDWAAATYYGEPAVKLGLHYLPYKIKPAESSLSDKYSSTDPILTNPATIVDKGWWTMKEVYLEGQDVRPSLVQMRKLFEKAKKLLKKRSPLL